MKLFLLLRPTASAALLALLSLSACSGDEPTAQDTRAPAIAIQGVEEGGVYQSAVTVQVSVDRGTYDVTLDGAPVVTPAVVGSFGDHVLRVVARDGAAVSDTTVSFSLKLPGSSVLIVRVLDLGENDAGGGGDAIVLTDSTASGSFHAVVDAGPGDGSFAYVVERLRQIGVDTLQMMVLSHAHSDHYQGMPAVLERIHVRRFLHNGQVRSLTSYNNVLASARTRADTTIVPTSVTTYRLAPTDSATEVTVIPPLPTYLSTDFDQGSDPSKSRKLNDGSIGMLLDRGDGAFRMFLTGDGEVEANLRWRTTFAALSRDVDVLKVGHHGANNSVFDNGFSGSSTWLSHTDPEVSIISANGTTHPRQAALNFLLGRTATRTYCTHVHGEIVLRVAPTGAYDVSVERNADKVCVQGTEANS